jgi:hypothetical protein
MRGRRTYRRLLPALLGVAALGLIGAAPAGAYLRDFQTVGLSSVVNSQTVKSVTVPCGGKLALGAGGAVISPFGNLGLDNLWVFFGQHNALNGGAETDSIGPRWLVTGRAFCATQTAVPPGGGGAPYIKNLSWKNRTSAANSLPFKSVVATCPAGKSAIGGGGEITGATNDLAFDSVRRAGAAGFRVRAHEVDPTSVGWSVTATAICANITSVPPGAQYVGGAPITGPDTGPGPIHTGTAAATASCPGAQRIIGGGAFLTGVAPGSPPPADVVLTVSRPISSTTWLGRARDTDPPNQPYHLQVRAVCG